MQTTIANPALWQRLTEAKRLTVLAAFDDSIACTRAKYFCQALTRDLGGRCKLVEHVWVFSTFRMKELQEIAAEEAAAAEVVIISTHEADGLPDEVKDWIERWLQLKGASKALLLAILDREPEAAPTLVHAYLRGVALRGGMDFVVQFGE
jgi:hypothetical protein